MKILGIIFFPICPFKCQFAHACFDLTKEASVRENTQHTSAIAGKFVIFQVMKGAPSEDHFLFNSF